MRSAKIMPMRLNKYALTIFLLTFPMLANAYNARLAERWFIGLEYERQHLEPESSISLGQGLSNVQTSFLKSMNNAYTAYFGYRFYDVGIRAGYTYSQTIEYSPVLYSSNNGQQIATGNVRQKSNNIFLDAFYYYAFASGTELKFMLGAGAMRTEFDSNLTGISAGTYTTNSFEPALRIGMGAQYQLASCLVADLMFKYQIPANNFFKYVSSVSVGLAWYF